MPLLFARLAGKEALAWLRHRRWAQFHGFPPFPSDREVPRWTGDDQERVTGDGILRVVVARPRLTDRVTADGQQRLTGGGDVRQVLAYT